MLDLLSLPARVLCGVLGENVSLKSLVRLDSVFCQRQRREEWLLFLSSRQFTFHGLVDLSQQFTALWLLNRLLKVSNVEFRTQSNFNNESEYLRFCGTSIRKVHFTHCNWRLGMIIVALCCKNVVILRLSRMCVSISLRHLLWNNPNIRELWFDGLTSSDTGIFNGLSFDTLLLLHVTNTASVDGFPWHNTATSSSLRTVVLRNTDNESFMRNVMHKCPVRSLSVNGGLIRCNQLLVNICLEGSLVFDMEMCVITTGATSLRTLSIRNCINVTDMSLLHIAHNAGGRLQVLHCDFNEPDGVETDGIMTIFSNKCTVLTYLNINCGDKALCSGKGLSLIVTGCPALKTLVVNKHSAIGMSARDLVALVRPNLRLLVHDASTVYDILSMPV